MAPRRSARPGGERPLRLTVETNLPYPHRAAILAISAPKRATAASNWNPYKST